MLSNLFILLFSTFKITSAICNAAGRWVTIKHVLSFRFLIFSNTAFSVASSKADVASSKSNTGRLDSIARAMASRCR